MRQKSKHVLCCGFCGKSNQNVEFMAASEKAAICNECIDHIRRNIDSEKKVFTLSEREGKSLWTALQALARFEREDEPGAILKNNAGQLEAGEVRDLVAKLREWGTDQVESDLARGSEFSVWRMKNGFVRVVARIKADQPEDFSVTGEEARKRYVEWILCTAAGMFPAISPAVAAFLKKLRSTDTS